MPARMIDGDALWRSDKLAQVKPPSYRAEYANLIPLALADGTFECNPRRVWADVYSYNRPDIDQDMVKKILAEFERVGLLSRKKDAAYKEWGFWVGIEARLPSESTRDRYKSGKSNLFNGEDNIVTVSRPTHDKVAVGLDRFGLEKDRIGASKGQYDFKTLGIRYRQLMGKSASHDTKTKDGYVNICSQFGEAAVLKAFEEWAEANAWKDKKPPLFFFYKDAPELIAESQAAAEPETPSMTPEEIAASIIARTATQDLVEEREKELAQEKVDIANTDPDQC